MSVLCVSLETKYESSSREAVANAAGATRDGIESLEHRQSVPGMLREIKLAVVQEAREFQTENCGHYDTPRLCVQAQHTFDTTRERRWPSNPRNLSTEVIKNEPTSENLTSLRIPLNKQPSSCFSTFCSVFRPTR